MISWIIVVVLLVIGIFAIRMNHFRHKIFIVGLLLFALFLYGSLVVVSSLNDFDLKTSEGIMDAGKLYFGWLGNGFKNLKTITGNAIGMDWTSTNGSFFDNSDDVGEKESGKKGK